MLEDLLCGPALAVEVLLHLLPLPQLALLRTLSSTIRCAIDSSRAAKRLSWGAPGFQGAPLALTPSNVTRDKALVVVEVEAVGGRKIMVYSALSGSLLSSLGFFPHPAFNCFAGLRLNKRKLTIFTTKHYEDILITYDLTDPRLPECKTLRTPGRLPLMCADVDRDHEMTVYNFSPTVVCTNNVATGRLEGRLETGQVVSSVLLGWPRGLALVKSRSNPGLLCLDLASCVTLYKVDTTSLSSKYELHLTRDCILATKITEKGVAVVVWVHREKEEMNNGKDKELDKELDKDKGHKPDKEGTLLNPPSNRETEWAKEDSALRVLLTSL